MPLLVARAWQRFSRSAAATPYSHILPHPFAVIVSVCHSCARAVMLDALSAAGPAVHLALLLASHLGAHVDHGFAMESAAKTAAVVAVLATVRPIMFLTPMSRLWAAAAPAHHPSCDRHARSYAVLRRQRFQVQRFGGLFEGLRASARHAAVFYAQPGARLEARLAFWLV